jgi:hypothetical protein
MFCSILAAEEPDCMTVAIRPGVVETGMQQELRGESAREIMGDLQQKFVDLKEKGLVLDPQVPAKAIAEIAVNPRQELSGKMWNWDEL